MTVDVSVLLPFRDADATIDEALESILAQRDVVLEIVAVDDGSRDDGPARVASYALRDARVRLLHTGGVGIVGALNIAARAARAPVFARMDADDIALPMRLARQRDVLAGDPTLAAVGTRVEAFPDDAVGEGLRRYVAWQNSVVTPEDHARELFVESPLCHPSVMMHRAAFESVGGYVDVPWPEDYDLWLRFDAHGFRLAKIPTVLLRWRRGDRQLTFTDPRYGRDRFLDAKAHYLAARLGVAQPIAIWGAGPTGRRLARALERGGLRTRRFVDIDPRKIGRIARGVSIVAPESIRPGAEKLLVAVGARGARELIRAHLTRSGFVEGADYVCAS